MDREFYPIRIETILTATTIDPTISGKASPVFFHLLHWRQQHMSDYASGIAKGLAPKAQFILRTRLTAFDSDILRE
ncbi:putative subtilisin-like protease SBT1.6 [Sesbania bispinosa]|nr:putative subtilisin-like protease SBT1.6 [Sesbania bispinosa]